MGIEHWNLTQPPSFNPYLFLFPKQAQNNIQNQTINQAIRNGNQGSKSRTAV